MSCRNPTREEREFREDQQRRVVRGFDSGETWQELVQELGISRATVYRRWHDGLRARGQYRCSRKYRIRGRA